MAAVDEKKKSVSLKVDDKTEATTRYDNLEWIHLNEVTLPGMQQAEGLREKLVRKTKENPFVPIGALATCVALTLGLMSMRGSNVKRSQLMMRFRIGAQGFTLAAILIGLAINANKSDAGT